MWSPVTRVRHRVTIQNTHIRTCMQAIKTALPHLHSVMVKQSADGLPTHLKPQPLHVTVLGQIEFLFSEKNLAHHQCMRELVQRAQDGWIQLTDILDIPFVRELIRADQRALAPIVSLVGTSTKLRLRHDTGSDRYFVRSRRGDDPSDDEQSQSDAVESSSSSSDVADADEAQLHIALDESAVAASSDEIEESDLESVPESLASADEPWQGRVRWLPGKVAADFALMQYNVLADFLATPTEFPYVSEGNLRWSARLTKVLGVIEHVDADIVCLNEVQFSSQPSHNHCKHIGERLGSLGYTGQALKKTGDRDLDIGNAVFWKATFEIVAEREVSLDEALGKCVD